MEYAACAPMRRACMEAASEPSAPQAPPPHAPESTIVAGRSAKQGLLPAGCSSRPLPTGSFCACPLGRQTASLNPPRSLRRAPEVLRTRCPSTPCLVQRHRRTARHPLRSREEESAA
jgi:hypothetical protein